MRESSKFFNENELGTAELFFCLGISGFCEKQEGESTRPLVS